MFEVLDEVNSLEKITLCSYHFIIKIMSRATRQGTRKGKKTPAHHPPPPGSLMKREKSILGSEWTSLYKHSRAESIANWSRTSKPTREHSLISEYIGITKPKREKSKLFPPI